MTRRGLAAITLAPEGGGIATAARLFWDVFQARWGRACRLFTLLPGSSRGASMTAGVTARLRFGAAVAAEQVLGRAEWMFYSHMGLARVQTMVPGRSRCPYIVFLHGIEAWKPLRAEQRRLLAGAALRIANSEFTAQRAQEVNPDIGPVRSCLLGLPRSASEPARSARPAPGASDAPSVVMVARMSASERYKGHDALIAAWPEVLLKHPAAQLVFVGTGDDLPRLRERASALGVARHVVFKGFLPDPALQEVYASASIFAMPSRGEGFGLAYLEAMAWGVPCIGSIHDAAREVIDDGVTGCLVDQGDVGGLSRRIVDLLTNDGVRRAWGAAGRRRFEQHFTAEKFAARFLDLIDLPAVPRDGRARPA